MTVEQFSHKRPRKGSVYVEDGIIYRGRSIGDVLGGTPYYPFTHRNLPNVFAKVHTEDDAVSFVQSFGMLGNEVEGDSVEWVLSHARTVRFALRLLSALQYPGENKLLEVLETERRDWEVPPGNPLAGLVATGRAALREGGIFGVYKLAVRDEADYWSIPVQGSILPEELEQSIPIALRQHALDLVTFMVNANTESVRHRLVAVDGHIRLHLGAKTLIEVIWYHVGDMALIEQHNNGSDDANGKAVRECEECGTPFLVTDRRERFCPSPFGGPSTCAGRNRIRRFRERQRQQKGES